MREPLGRRSRARFRRGSCRASWPSRAAARRWRPFSLIHGSDCVTGRRATRPRSGFASLAEALVDLSAAERRDLLDQLRRAWSDVAEARLALPASLPLLIERGGGLEVCDRSRSTSRASGGRAKLAKLRSAGACLVRAGDEKPCGEAPRKRRPMRAGRSFETRTRACARKSLAVAYRHPLRHGERQPRSDQPAALPATLKGALCVEPEACPVASSPRPPTWRRSGPRRAMTSTPASRRKTYALSGDEAKTREAGCDDYVAKPFSPRQLLAKINQLLP
jgi:hypothetical protein